MKLQITKIGLELASTKDGSSEMNDLRERVMFAMEIITVQTPCTTPDLSSWCVDVAGQLMVDREFLESDLTECINEGWVEAV